MLLRSHACGSMSKYCKNNGSKHTHTHTQKRFLTPLLCVGPSFRYFSCPVLLTLLLLLSFPHTSSSLGSPPFVKKNPPGLSFFPFPFNPTKNTASSYSGLVAL